MLTPRAGSGRAGSAGSGRAGAVGAVGLPAMTPGGGIGVVRSSDCSRRGKNAAPGKSFTGPNAWGPPTPRRVTPLRLVLRTDAPASRAVGRSNHANPAARWPIQCGGTKAWMRKDGVGGAVTLGAGGARPGCPARAESRLSWRVLFETSTSGAAGRQDPRLSDRRLAHAFAAASTTSCPSSAHHRQEIAQVGPVVVSHLDMTR